MCLPYFTEDEHSCFRVMHANSDSLITLYLVKTVIFSSTQGRISQRAIILSCRLMRLMRLMMPDKRRAQP